MSLLVHDLEITQESSLHHYRTEIPNIIFQMNLDPYEFKTYCILKMTAGDKGSCFKSTETLCEEVGCQKPKLIEIKKTLVSKGLIKLDKRKHANGGNMPDLITIIDVWGLNMKVMSEKYPNKGGGNLELRGGVIVDYQGGNLRLPKQEHKEQEKKEQQQEHAAASLEKQPPKPRKCFPILDNVDIPMSDKEEISNRYPVQVITNAIAWATHPETKLNKGLAPAIKWACQNKPEIPIAKEAVEEKNKSYAARYDGIKNGSSHISACNKHVEIVHAGCAKAFSLLYNANGFMDQFHSALRKGGFNVL